MKGFLGRVGWGGLGSLQAMSTKGENKAGDQAGKPEAEMKLKYKEQEVIRLCSEAIVQAFPVLKKDWIKEKIEVHLMHFEESEHRDGNEVSVLRKALIVRAAMEIAWSMVKDVEGSTGKANVQRTWRDLEENSQAWFGFSVEDNYKVILANLVWSSSEGFA